MISWLIWLILAIFFLLLLTAALFWWLGRHSGSHRLQGVLNAKDSELSRAAHRTGEWEAKYAKLQRSSVAVADFDALKLNFANQETECAALKEEAARALKLRRDLEDQLAQTRGERDGARRSLEDARKTTVPLTDHDAARKGLAAAEAARSKAEADLKAALAEKQKLDAELGSARADVKRLVADIEKERRSHAEAKRDVDKWRADHEAARSELSQVQLSHLPKADFEALTLSLSAKEKEFTSLQAQADSDLASLRKSLRDREEDLKRAAEEAAKLRGELEAKAKAEADLEALRGKAAEHEAAARTREAEVARLKADLVPKADLDSLKQSLAAKERDFAATDSELGQLRRALSARDHDLETARAEAAKLRGELEAKAKAEADLEALRGKAAEHEAAARTREAEVARLKADLVPKADLDSLRQSLAAKERDFAATDSELGQLRRALSARDHDLETTRAEAAKLRGELEAKTKAQAKAEADLAASLERLESVEKAAAQPPLAATSALAASLGAAAAAPKDLEVHERFGVLYTKPPREADDLKEIVGVAEVFEKKLNRAGVYRFEQIARWDPSTANDFSASVGFPGRARREFWVEQCRKLHFQKHGQNLGSWDAWERHLTKTEAEVGLSAAAFAEDVGSGAARVDRRFGVLYSKRPAKVDDLKEIVGVAEVFEKKLHESGIYRFKQIALWSEDTAESFSDQLGFPGRAGREYWVEQCRKLHFEKYGERLGSWDKWEEHLAGRRQGREALAGNR